MCACDLVGLTKGVRSARRVTTRGSGLVYVVYPLQGYGMVRVRVPVRAHRMIGNIRN